MLDERTKTWATATLDEIVEDLRSIITSDDAMLEQYLLSLPAPEIVPCPEGLYERIIELLDRMSKADRRRARQRRKKRRGWA